MPRGRADGERIPAVRTRLARAVVALGLSVSTAGALAGCSGGPAPLVSLETPAPEPTTPTYDAALEPAAAVMALVPQQATRLRVTDLDAVRADLGVDLLTTARPVAEQDDFWARAAAGSPLLDDGLLRPVDDRLRAGYGLSQTDVSWEAHFTDDAGTELGWVLGLRPGVDAAAVQRAVDDGVGALAGSTWRPDDLLVVRGTTDDGAASWAADPDLLALVGLPAEATYVEQGCVADPGAPATLDEVDRWSVQLESTLVTARLGPDRTDLFDRLRLATSTPSFTAAYEGGVADPLTGRLGFRMADPPLAADQARRRVLPFASCSAS